MSYLPTRRWSKSALFIPLYLWLIYSIATILIFEFGPLDFLLENKFLLYGYLLAAHLAVICGYCHGYRKVCRIGVTTFNPDFVNLKLLQAFAFLILAFIAINILRDFISGASMQRAVQNAMEAKEAYSETRGGGLLGYISAFLSVLVIPFLVAATVSFRRLDKLSKLALLLLILRIIYDAILGSSRASLFMLLIVLLFSVLVMVISGQLRLSVKGVIVYFIPLVLIFLAYSSYIAMSRQTVQIEDMAEYMSQNSKYEFNEDSLLVPKFQGDLKLLNAGVLTGYFYFGHAYRGLHDALELPFKGTTFFFGHSDFAIRNLSRVFGDEVLDYSLHYRLISEGKSASTVWVTAYTGIASDTTFIGSLAVLYFFGVILAKSFIKSVFRPTLTSYAAVGWMGYFFFQTNMTFVAADLGAFMSFWGVVFLSTFKFKKMRAF